MVLLRKISCRRIPARIGRPIEGLKMSRTILAAALIVMAGASFGCERQPAKDAQCVVSVDLERGEMAAIFPVLNAQDRWRWKLSSTDDTRTEYIWRLNLGRCNEPGSFESGEYGLGITLYKWLGDSEHSGTLAELLRASQVDVWRKELKDHKTAYDRLEEYNPVAGVSKRGVMLWTRDRKATEFLFKGKPPSAYLEAILSEPNQSYSCLVDIDYVR
jgi:hypothetical protein